MARPKFITIVALIGGVVAWRLVSEMMAEQEREQSRETSADEPADDSQVADNAAAAPASFSTAPANFVTVHAHEPEYEYTYEYEAEGAVHADETPDDADVAGELERHEEPAVEAEPEVEPEPEVAASVQVEEHTNQPPPAVTASLAAAEINRLADAVSPPAPSVAPARSGQRLRSTVSVLLAVVAIALACSAIVSPGAWWSLGGIIAGIVLAIIASFIPPRTRIESRI